MIKIGDHLQPTEQARVNYGFDALGIKLPIVAVNVFQVKEGPTYVQFLAPDIYNRDGAMILRTWNARNLVPYKPKPRYKLVPVISLKHGDEIWHPLFLKQQRIGYEVARRIDDAVVHNEAIEYYGYSNVWKQTTPDTHAH